MADIFTELHDAMADKQLARVYDLIPKLLKMHEDGLIPVLPCKVGDTVYFVDDEIHHAVVPYTICKISFEHGEVLFWYSMEWCSAPLALCNLNDFGKTVFLTKEEAEAALKGSKA